MPSALEWARAKRQAGAPAAAIRKVLQRAGALDENGRAVPGMAERDIDEMIVARGAVPPGPATRAAPASTAARPERPAGRPAAFDVAATTAARRAGAADLPGLGVARVEGAPQGVPFPAAEPGPEHEPEEPPPAPDLPERARRLVAVAGGGRAALPVARTFAEPQRAGVILGKIADPDLPPAARNALEERLLQAQAAGVDLEDEEALLAVADPSPPPDVGAVETVVKRAAAVPVRIAGGVAGLATGAYKAAQEAAGVGGEEAPTAIAEAYGLVEEDIAARMEAYYGGGQGELSEEARQAEGPTIGPGEEPSVLERGLPEGPTGRLAMSPLKFGQAFFSDVRDNFLAILELATEAVGARVTQEEVAAPAGKFFAGQFGAGRALGEGLFAGAVGGTAALLAGPKAVLEAFATRPFSLAMILLPVLRAVPRPKLSPALRGLLDKAEAVERAVKATGGRVAGAVGEAAAGPIRKVVQKVSPTGKKRVPLDELVASARRAVGETNITQATPGQTRIVGEMAFAGPEGKAQATGAGEALARAIEREQITPAEVMGPVERRPSHPGGLPMEQRLQAVNITAKHQMERLGATMKLWEQAAAHEVPEVRANLAARMPGFVAYRNALAQAIERFEQLPADKKTPAAAAQASARRQRLTTLDPALARIEGILRGGDDVPNRPGAPLEYRTTEIPKEVPLVGGTRSPLAVGEAEEALGASQRLTRATALKHLTPEEIEQYPTLKAPAGLVQAERAPVRTPVTQEPTLAHPRFQALAADLIEAVREVYRPGDFVRKEPEPILRIRAAQLGRAGAVFASDPVILRMIGSVFDDQQAAILRSPVLRKEAAERIRKRVPEITADHIEGRLSAMSEAALPGFAETGRPLNYVETVQTPAGPKVVNYFDEVAQVVADAAPRKMAEIRAEALRRLVNEVSRDVREARFAVGVMDEIKRFKQDVAHNPEVAANIVRGVLLGDEPVPQIFNRAENTGPRIADTIETHADRWIAEIVEAKGITPHAARRRLEWLTTRLRNNYAPTSEALKAHLPGGANAPKLLAEEAALKAEETPFGITQVHRGFESTMGWQMRAMSAVEADTAGSALLRMMGTHYTSQNPATHVNNIMSSVGIQSLSYGKTPVGVLLDVGRSLFDDWRRYRNGEMAGTPLGRILRGVEQSDLFDTTLVDAEIGTTGTVARGAVRAADALQRAASWVYKHEDVAFKLDEAVRNAKGLVRTLDDARKEPGVPIEMPVNELRRLRITPEADGTLRAEAVLPDGHTRPLTEPQMWRELGRAAGAPAQRKLFDYSKVNNVIHALRASRLQGILTPWLTWHIKALDIPGVKRGLLHEVLMGDVGVRVKTRNRAIVHRQRLAAAEVALRRAFALTAMRQDIIDKDDQALRKLMNRIPRNSALIVLDNVTNPGFLGFKDWESGYFAGPTDTLFNVGLGAYVTASEAMGGDYSVEHLYPAVKDKPGRVDLGLEGLPPEERANILELRKLWIANKTGELWAFEDVLRLAGLAGSPMVQLQQMILAAGRSGQSIDAPAIYRYFGTLITGGILHNLADAVIGAVDPNSPWSQRSRSFGGEDFPPESKDLTRYAIRKITSLGWRVNDIEEYEKAQGRGAYFKALNTAFTTGLVRPARDRLTSMEDEGGHSREELRAAEMEVERNESIVSREIDQIEAQYREVIDKVRHPGGRR